MIAEEISSLKKFMHALFCSDTFDSFFVHSISITTFATVTYDGRIVRDYYSEDDPEKDYEYCTYKMLRPFCYQTVKGSKLPVRFKFILALKQSHIRQLLNEIETTITQQDVNGLFINIKYEAGKAYVTTGTSLNIFTMDKSLEQTFDRYISKLVSTLCD